MIDLSVFQCEGSEFCKKKSLFESTWCGREVLCTYDHNTEQKVGNQGKKKMAFCYDTGPSPGWDTKGAMDGLLLLRQPIKCRTGMGIALLCARYPKHFSRNSIGRCSELRSPYLRQGFELPWGCFQHETVLPGPGI